MNRAGSETQVYEQLARYMTYLHRELAGHWHFDLSGVNNPSKASRGLYGRLNQRGYPDFFLAYPAKNRHGLYLEIKREGVPIRKQDGAWASEHIAEQAKRLELLRRAGYEAHFAQGIDQAVKLVEQYLAPPKGTIPERKTSRYELF